MAFIISAISLKLSYILISATIWFIGVVNDKKLNVIAPLIPLRIISTIDINAWPCQSIVIAVDIEKSNEIRVELKEFHSKIYLNKLKEKKYKDKNVIFILPNGKEYK